MRPASTGREQREERAVSNRVGREIAVVLLAKLAALVVIYFAFFDASRRPQVSAVVMAAKLVAPQEAPRR
jgi:hypothetical protein